MANNDSPQGKTYGQDGGPDYGKTTSGTTVGGTTPGAPVAAASSSAMPTSSFVGFPKTKWHPVYGARSANDPNEAASIFQPAHDWFDTPAEADMHRTDREAQQVMHYNRQLKVDAKVAAVNGEEAAPLTGEGAPKGIVRNSVAATESLNAGNAEPL